MRMYPPALAQVYATVEKYKWCKEGLNSITFNSSVELTKIHLHTKFERNPYRNADERAHTRMSTKNDLWSYKRRNTGGSNTKRPGRVDFTKIHHHTKFERNPYRNAAVRVHTNMWHKDINQNYLWPYKRRNTGGSTTKNTRWVELTKIHLPTKFETNPCTNIDERAHTRMSTKNDLWPL